MISYYVPGRNAGEVEAALVSRRNSDDSSSNSNNTQTSLSSVPQPEFLALLKRIEVAYQKTEAKLGLPTSPPAKEQPSSHVPQPTRLDKHQRQRVSIVETMVGSLNGSL